MAIYIFIDYTDVFLNLPYHIYHSILDSNYKPPPSLPCKCGGLWSWPYRQIRSPHIISIALISANLLHHKKNTPHLFNSKNIRFVFKNRTFIFETKTSVFENKSFIYRIAGHCADYSRPYKDNSQLNKRKKTVLWREFPGLFVYLLSRIQTRGCRPDSGGWDYTLWTWRR